MAIGVSPLATRSAAGKSDSTTPAFWRPRSRMNFSAFSLPMILSRLASHWVVVVCWVGSGMTSLPLYCGLARSSSDLGVFVRLERRFIVDHADDDVAIARPQVGIDDFFGKSLLVGESYLLKEAFLLHHVHDVIVGDDGVERGLPARNSLMARSMTLVADARQYSASMPVFFLKPWTMASMVSASSDP